MAWLMRFQVVQHAVGQQAQVFAGIAHRRAQQRGMRGPPTYCSADMARIRACRGALVLVRKERMPMCREAVAPLFVLVELGGLQHLEIVAAAGLVVQRQKDEGHHDPDEARHGNGVAARHDQEQRPVRAPLALAQQGQQRQRQQYAGQGVQQQIPGQRPHRTVRAAGPRSSRR